MLCSHYFLVQSQGPALIPAHYTKMYLARGELPCEMPALIPSPNLHTGPCNIFVVDLRNLLR